MGRPPPEYHRPRQIVRLPFPSLPLHFTTRTILQKPRAPAPPPYGAHNLPPKPMRTAVPPPPQPRASVPVSPVLSSHAYTFPSIMIMPFKSSHGRVKLYVSWGAIGRSGITLSNYPSNIRQDSVPQFAQLAPLFLLYQGRNLIGTVGPLYGYCMLCVCERRGPNDAWIIPA